MNYKEINGVQWPATETKSEAESVLIECLEARGLTDLTASEITDFCLKGGETVAEIDEMAQGFCSECQTEISENKRVAYEQEYCQDFEI